MYLYIADVSDRKYGMWFAHYLINSICSGRLFSWKCMIPYLNHKFWKLNILTEIVTSIISIYIEKPLEDNSGFEIAIPVQKLYTIYLKVEP